MNEYLASLTEPQRKKIRRDSQKALRQAWPHRGDLRSNQVIAANVRMLRVLSAF